MGADVIVIAVTITTVLDFSILTGVPTLSPWPRGQSEFKSRPPKHPA